MKKIVLILALALAALSAHSTTVVGTVIGPDGNGINGRIVFILSNPGQNTSTHQAVSVYPVVYPLYAGVPPIYASVIGNDIVLPSGTYYVVDVYDTAGNLLSENNYIITGATFDVGQAVPTSLTTSNLSFQNPALLNVSNTWTATQTFTALQWSSGTSFLGVFLHSNTANRNYAFPDTSGNVVLDVATQTLTNKTLASPTTTGADAGVETLSNKTLATAPVAGGAAAGLTGTGACATITTQAGGSWAGMAKCAGTTGASTVTITPGTTAPNGWFCSAYDETTRANLFQQTAHTTAACTLTATSVTANDVFVFKAVAF